ncbi:MAG: caspase family protein [Fluviicola sp.]|nr:caspase family protein [Fluviicola sp.]
MTGYALLIGANELKKDHYASNMPLNEAVTNINSVEAFLVNTVGFQSTNIKKLSGATADWENTVLTELANLRNITITETEKPFVFIYISCHGAKIKFQNEEYTHKNFLCFYDRMALENELREQIELFKVDFKVHIMIDSCYSEGLDFDYLREQQIGDSQFFQGVLYTHYQSYKNKIDSFVKREPAYKADTCYIYSTRQEVKGLLGASLNKPTLFTKYYLNFWKNYIGQSIGTRLNYMDFNNYILRQFMHIKYNPVVKIYPSPIKSDNFFYRTPPFIFSYPSVAINNPVSLTINLIETANDKLVVKLDNVQPSYLVEETPFIWDLKINVSDGYLNALKANLESIEWDVLKGIDYIGVINVSIQNHSIAIPPLQKTIESLNCLPLQTGDEGNVLIVFCDTENNYRIVGHKRSRGKVTNSIG